MFTFHSFVLIFSLLMLSCSADPSIPRHNSWKLRMLNEFYMKKEKNKKTWTSWTFFHCSLAKSTKKAKKYAPFRTYVWSKLLCNSTKNFKTSFSPVQTGSSARQLRTCTRQNKVRTQCHAHALAYTFQVTYLWMTLPEIPVTMHIAQLLLSPSPPEVQCSV